MIDINHIKNRFSPEIALMILTCRSYFCDETKIELKYFISDENIDWNLFYEICKNYEIAPFIYKVLSHENEYIGLEDLEKFRLSSLKISFKNLQMLNQLIHLSDVFKRKNISIVHYKGLLLSRVLYGDFLTRDCCDIDLLIHPEDYSLAIKVLKDEGYLQEANSVHDIEQKERFSCQSKLIKTLENGFVISLEVHWDPILRMLNVPLRNRNLIGSLIQIDCNGNQLPFLSPENNFYSLIGHHGVNDVWRTPKHILDIAAFTEKYKQTFDWISVFKKMRVYKIARTGEMGLVLANDLFGTFIPNGIDQRLYNSQKIIEKLLTYPIEDKNKLSLSSFLQRLVLRDTFKDKVVLTMYYFLYRPYFIIRSFMQQMRLKY